jgi:hypothetical protein
MPQSEDEEHQTDDVSEDSSGNAQGIQQHEIFLCASNWQVVPQLWNDDVETWERLLRRDHKRSLAGMHVVSLGKRCREECP